MPPKYFETLWRQYDLVELKQYQSKRITFNLLINIYLASTMHYIVQYYSKWWIQSNMTLATLNVRFIKWKTSIKKICKWINYIQSHNCENTMKTNGCRKGTWSNWEFEWLSWNLKDDRIKDDSFFLVYFIYILQRKGER